MTLPGLYARCENKSSQKGLWEHAQIGLRKKKIEEHPRETMGDIAQVIHRQSGLREEAASWMPCVEGGKKQENGTQQGA